MKLATNGSHGDPSFENFITLLERGEKRANSAINLTPSENVLSPCARLPFIADIYSRYYFESSNGQYAFFGALEAGEIESSIVVPLLRQMAHARFVNVKPLSGLNCMAVALSTIASAGDVIMTVPETCGGHTSTAALGRRLGLEIVMLPMASPHEIDLDRLRLLVGREQPAAIYLDQSTVLFPIDPQPIRHIVDECSPNTRIHYDASHINGLIIGNAIGNPLDRGADSFGGSTHKTLPGPHKGFLATNDPELDLLFERNTTIFVSHHQPAAVASLAVTLLEMMNCGGENYASQIMENARIFGSRMAERGLAVASAARGFTGCHQIWVDPGMVGSDDGAIQRIVTSGIRLNQFSSLPEIPRTSLRMSVAEITRCGALEGEVIELADVIADLLVEACSVEQARIRVMALHDTLSSPAYCYGLDDLKQHGAGIDILNKVGSWAI